HHVPTTAPIRPADDDEASRLTRLPLGGAPLDRLHDATPNSLSGDHAAFPFVAVVARRYARRAVSRETWNRSASAGHVHPSSRSSASSAVCWSVRMCVQPIERRSFCSSSSAWASAWTISRSASRASSGGLTLATPFSASSRRRIVCCIASCASPSRGTYLARWWRTQARRRASYRCRWYQDMLA